MFCSLVIHSNFSPQWSAHCTSQQKVGVCCCICSDPQGREKAEGRSCPLWLAQSCRQAAEPFTVRGLPLAYRPVYPKGGTEEAMGLWLQYFPSQKNHPTSCAEQQEENKRINWRVVFPVAPCSQNPSRKLYLCLCRWWYAGRTYLSSTCLPNMVPFYFFLNVKQSVAIIRVWKIGELQEGNEELIVLPAIQHNQCHVWAQILSVLLCAHISFLFVCLVELHPMHCFATCFPFNVSKTSPHIFQCVIGCRATHIKAQGFKIIIVFRGQIFKDMEEWTLFLKRQ